MTDKMEDVEGEERVNFVTPSKPLITQENTTQQQQQQQQIRRIDAKRNKPPLSQARLNSLIKAREAKRRKRNELLILKDEQEEMKEKLSWLEKTIKKTKTMTDQFSTLVSTIEDPTRARNKIENVNNREHENGIMGLNGKNNGNINKESTLKTTKNTIVNKVLIYLSPLITAIVPLVLIASTNWLIGRDSGKNRSSKFASEVNSHLNGSSKIYGEKMDLDII